MRAFIAVKIPEDLKKNLVALQEEIRKDFPKEIKFAEPENIHITLKFFDNINEGKAEKIKNAIAALSFDSFKAKCVGVGAFPNEKFIRVVWAGAESGGKLESLVDELNRNLSELGFTPDQFSSHATLGRVRRHIDFSKEIEKFKGKEFGEFEISKESIVLKRSRLTPEGPIYTDL